MTNLQGVALSDMGLLLLLSAQTFALVVLVLRLLPGRKRTPALRPPFPPARERSVSVIVPTLNEAERIGPCLDGLMQQGPSMLEAIVVDSNSTDGTQSLVHVAAQRDARIRLVSDGSLPEGWIGKVWALETGLQQARGEWVLGIDADTQPSPGLTDGVVLAATKAHLYAASFAPRFDGQGAAERWLQPAMLVTLIYRTGAAGAGGDPDRILANGQCFLVRRSLLMQLGGYAPARHSFSDDVTLARHLARHGARVGFLDGAHMIVVRGYASARRMWSEWGRSFDLADSTTRWRSIEDLILVWLAQALPLPLLVWTLWSVVHNGGSTVEQLLLLANAVACGIRLLMLVAIRHNYAVRGMPFWLSWTADIPAAVRLTASVVRRPREWRGRRYG